MLCYVFLFKFLAVRATHFILDVVENISKILQLSLKHAYFVVCESTFLDVEYWLKILLHILLILFANNFIHIKFTIQNKKGIILEVIHSLMELVLLGAKDNSKIHESYAA